jgi:hypothetical protein
MNRLPLPRKTRVLNLLVNGNSLGTVCRLEDVSLNAVTKLLLDVGRACSDYQDGALRNLPCKHIEVHEIWSFRRNSCQSAESGHVWAWTALCADTRLVPSWFVGPRHSETFDSFISELAGRLANRVQLTYEGGRIYLDAVTSIFGVAADSTHIVKAHRRRSVIQANPSIGDRTKFHSVGGADLDMHFVPRRSKATRLAMRQRPILSPYAKRIMGLEHSVSLHCMFHNFAQIQEDSQVTPGMAAGVSDHCWSLDDIAQLAS